MVKARKQKSRAGQAATQPAELGERVAFRVSASMRLRLEQHARRIMLRSPGLHVSRSDAARMLLADALEQAERASGDAAASPPDSA